MIKPVSDRCNLQCRYCFYQNKTPYPHSVTQGMNEIVLEHLIRSYLATPQPCYTFTWQGGEPTLLGYDFFRRVVELQKKYGRAGSVVANGVQTNATLLTDKLCTLFRTYNFLVGCSLDGPAEIHDRYRTTEKGKPTHASVMGGIEMMQRHGVDFNIMTLVSQANVHKAGELYRYFRDQGFFFQQYIPCVEFDEKGKLQPFAINGPEWGAFLCGIFDEWFPDDIHSVSVRHFDTILAKLVANKTDTCTIGKECQGYLVVEHNGDIYPCDFFVRKGLLLGNIMKKKWEQLLTSATYSEFGARKSRWSGSCDVCEYLDLCGGDCIKHRRGAADSTHEQSFLCPGWKLFFQHTAQRFGQIAACLPTRNPEGL
ncbi:MAG: anaerobic sulfatase maturase [Desulfobulbaceae bacterium]